MDVTNLPPVVLLVLGILMLLKALFAIVRPHAFKRLCLWWSGAASQVNTLAAIVCLFLFVAIWVVVLMRQPLVNWLLLLFGALFAWGASLYFRPLALQRVLRVAILDRKPGMIRALYTVVALVAAVLIWVAIQHL